MKIDEQILVNTGDFARLIGVGKSKLYSMLSANLIGIIPKMLDSKKMWSVDEIRLWVQAGCPNCEQWQKIKGKKGR